MQNRSSENKNTKSYLELHLMFLLNDKSTIITLQYMIYKQQPQRLGKDNSINESSLELEYFISFDQ